MTMDNDKHENLFAKYPQPPTGRKIKTEKRTVKKERTVTATENNS